MSPFAWDSLKYEGFEAVAQGYLLKRSSNISCPVIFWTSSSTQIRRSIAGNGS